MIRLFGWLPLLGGKNLRRVWRQPHVYSVRFAQLNSNHLQPNAWEKKKECQYLVQKKITPCECKREYLWHGCVFDDLAFCAERGNGCKQHAKPPVGLNSCLRYGLMLRSVRHCCLAFQPECSWFKALSREFTDNSLVRRKWFTLPSWADFRVEYGFPSSSVKDCLNAKQRAESFCQFCLSIYLCPRFTATWSKLRSWNVVTRCGNFSSGWT